jgi:hypothetical protein
MEGGWGGGVGRGVRMRPPLRCVSGGGKEGLTYAVGCGLCTLHTLSLGTKERSTF